MLANVCGVLFASERSAWLGFMIAFFCWASIVSRELMLKGLAALTCGSVFAWYCIPVVQTRLLPLLDWQHEVSSKTRVAVWKEAINCFLKNPITGVGATKFPRLPIKEAIVPGRSIALDDGHSNYLHVLATTGVVGFLSFLFIVFSSLVVSWRSYKQKSWATSLRAHIDKAIGLSTLCATIALLVSGIFEYNFGTGPVRLPQWWVMALIVLPAVPRPAPKN